MSSSTIRRAGVAAAACLILVPFCGCDRSPEAKAARYLERGKKFRESKDFNRAALEFRNAATALPNQAEAYYQLALLHLDQNQPAQAIPLLNKAVSLDPKHREAQVRLSQLMAATGDKNLVERASAEAQQLVGASPKDVESLNLLAMTEVKSGKPFDATRHLEEALKIMPGNLKAAANLATLKIVQRDFDGAEKALKDAQAAMPQSPKPLIALGRFYILMRKPAEAEQQLQLALKMTPNDAATVRDLAQLSATQGKFAEAAQRFQQLSKLPPAENRLVYGDFLFEQGKQADAAAEFGRLLKADSKDREAWLRLTKVYLTMGRRSDAERLNAEALNQNPKNVDALVQRAQFRLAAGKLDEAQADAQKALSFAKDSAVAHYLMGVILRMRGNSLSARQEFGHAVNSNPQMTPARVALAQVLIAQGKPDAALDLLRVAPAAVRDDPRLLIQGNWALMALGKWDDLRKAIDHSLEASKDLPKNPELLLQDGISKVHQKDFSAGEKSLAQALEANPNDVRPLKVIAGIYMNKGPDVALQTVTEYAKRYPDRIPVQEFLGNWFMETGRVAQARSVFAGIKAGHRDYADADLWLARCDLADGRKAEAKATLLRLTGSKQLGAQASLVLGTMEQAEGKVESAIEFYRAALAYEPENVMALNNLAALLAATRENVDAALQYAKTARSLAPENPIVRDTLGWTLFRKGNYAQSVEELEGVVAVLPSALPRYHLAMAYAKMHKPEQARKTLDQALKLDPKLPEAVMATALVER